MEIRSGSPFLVLTLAMEAGLGFTVRFLSPMTIVIGLILLFYGYKTK